MKPHHYRFEIVEVDAMEEFPLLIQVRNSAGEVTGTLDEEKQNEIREQLTGKIFIKLMLVDVEFDQSLIEHSPIIEPDNAGYWCNQMVSIANKKIAKLIAVKYKASQSSIILTNGRFPKS